MTIEYIHVCFSFSFTMRRIKDTLKHTYPFKSMVGQGQYRCAGSFRERTLFFFLSELSLINTLSDPVCLFFFFLFLFLFFFTFSFFFSFFLFLLGNFIDSKGDEKSGGGKKNCQKKREEEKKRGMIHKHKKSLFLVSSLCIYK